jgi:hypothetical protein
MFGEVRILVQARLCYVMLHSYTFLHITTVSYTFVQFRIFVHFLALSWHFAQFRIHSYAHTHTSVKFSSV